MLNQSDQMCQSCKIKVNKTILTFMCSPFCNYLFVVFEPTLFGLDLFYNYSKYHYAFHYPSFVLQCVHVCYILYYSCLTVLYFNVKCLRLFDFILNVEICLLHCRTPLFLLIEPGLQPQKSIPQ